MKKLSIFVFLIAAISVVSCLPVQPNSPTTEIVTPILPIKEADTPSPTPLPRIQVAIDGTYGLYKDGIPLTISNKGDHYANDLKVEICISRIAEEWKSVISGVSAITVEPDKAMIAWEQYSGSTSSSDSLVFLQSYAYNDSCYPATSRKIPNTVVVKITELAPNKSLYLRVRVVPAINIMQTDYSGMLYIKSPIDSMTLDSENVIIGQLVSVGAEYVKDLRTRLIVGLFNIRATCDNCSAVEKVEAYSFTQDQSIAGCKLLSREGAFDKISCMLAVSYFLPSTAHDQPQIPKEVFLSGTHDNGEYTFQEIAREEFLEEIR